MTESARKEVERQIDENRAAIQKAEQESRRIHEVLKESQRVRRDVLPKLKKAGQVR